MNLQPEDVATEATGNVSSAAVLTPETIEPYGRHVLIKRLPKATITAGGIILPDNYNEKNLVCELLKVGSGFRDDNGDLVVATKAKVGSYVIVNIFDGKKLPCWLDSAKEGESAPDYLIVDGLYVDAIVKRDTTTGDGIQSEKETDSASSDDDARRSNSP